MYILPAQHITTTTKKPQKKHLWLICVQYTVYTYINTDMYVTFKSSCIFRTSGPDSNKNGPDDPASRTALRLLTEILHLHTTLPSGPNNHPHFLRVPKYYQCPQSTRSLENYAHPPKILVINVCFHLRGFVYKLLLVIVVSTQVL